MSHSEQLSFYFMSKPHIPPVTGLIKNIFMTNEQLWPK